MGTTLSVEPGPKLIPGNGSILAEERWLFLSKRVRVLNNMKKEPILYGYFA